MAIFKLDLSPVLSKFPPTPPDVDFPLENNDDMLNEKLPCRELVGVEEPALLAEGDLPSPGPGCICVVLR